MSDFLKRVYDYANMHFVANGIKRKYTGENYMVHPEEVANIVSSVTDDETIIAAALLHDTVEDTPVTLDDILREFNNPRLVSLVNDVTDVSRPEDGNRKYRKRLDCIHLSLASPDAMTVKLADIISNSRSIYEFDAKFALVYMNEIDQILNVIGDGDPSLMSIARELQYKYNLLRL